MHRVARVCHRQLSYLFSKWAPVFVEGRKGGGLCIAQWPVHVYTQRPYQEQFVVRP